MKKKLLLLAAAGMMTMAMTMTAFAGQWKQESAGWWYDNEDGTYPSNGWTWVDGRCYYFTPEGYCLMNTQTPDGYQVDASGAWVVNGVVQIQNQTQETANQQTGQNTASSSVQFEGMTFTPPDGFFLDETDEDGYSYKNGNGTVVIELKSALIDETGQLGELLDSLAEGLIDEAMQSEVGIPDAKMTKQLPTGAWYYYGYNNSDKTGIPGSVHIYARISNGRLMMILCGGTLTLEEADSVMTNNLK